MSYHEGENKPPEEEIKRISRRKLLGKALWRVGGVMLLTGGGGAIYTLWSESEKAEKQAKSRTSPPAPEELEAARLNVNQFESSFAQRYIVNGESIDLTDDQKASLRESYDVLDRQSEYSKEYRKIFDGNHTTEKVYGAVGVGIAGMIIHSAGGRIHDSAESHKHYLKSSTRDEKFVEELMDNNRKFNEELERETLDNL